MILRHGYLLIHLLLCILNANARLKRYKCPAGSKGLVEVDVDFGEKERVPVLITVSEKKASCILARVHVSNQNVDLNDPISRRTSSNEDYITIPIARSYQGRSWERVAGIFERTKIRRPNGNVSKVFITKIPSLPEARYFLMTETYRLRNYDQIISRFFSHTTFGPTTSMIKNFSPRTSLGLIEWTKSQMLPEETPPTYHREYFRRHCDFPLLAARQFNFVAAHPCEPFSRWKDYAFDEWDWRDNWNKIVVTKLPNGHFLVEKRGVPKTVVEEFVSVDGIIEGAGDYKLCLYFEARLGGEVRMMNFPNGSCHKMKGGNPLIVLPPEILNDSTYADRVKILTSLPEMSDFTYIPPVATPNSHSDLTSLSSWRLDAGITNEDECNAVGKQREFVYGLTPNYESDNAVLIYAKYAALRENTLENPSPDGGKSDVTDDVKVVGNDAGNYFLSKSPKNFMNADHCIVATNRTVVGQVDSAIVCGSRGEVASEPNLPVEETNMFRTMFTGNLLFDDVDEQRVHVWSMINLSAEDQLRQRMAFALSNIFVVNLANLDGGHIWTEQYLSYYDIFVRHAFGNYRDILKEVSYNSVMGSMLTYEGSKSNSYIFRTTGIRGTSPDENFSREIMQLFTIGLDLLNTDGTTKLKGGEPIPAFDASDVTSLARAWTGFNQAPVRSNIEGDGLRKYNKIDPMFIDGLKRDPFPKANTIGGFIGDTYPLCIDLPPRQYLKRGATYSALGARARPELDTDPASWYHPVYFDRMKHVDLKPDSALYKILCNPDDDGTCNFKVNNVLQEDIDCYDEEQCKFDTVRVVRISSNVGDVYMEYIKPPCVHQAFPSNEDGKQMKVAKRGGSLEYGDYGACFHRKSDDIALFACCTQADSNAVPLVGCEYTGERMSFDTNKDRCDRIASGGNSPDARMCWFNGAILGEWPASCRVNWGNHVNNKIFWTSEDCSIFAKVRDDDGRIALVHDITPDEFPDREVPTFPALDKMNVNYFKVHWEDGQFPTTTTNSCGDDCEIGQEIHGGETIGTCYCEVEVTDTAAFNSNILSIAEIRSTLTVGFPDPSIFDEGTFKNPTVVDDVLIFHKEGESEFSIHTVFGIPNIHRREGHSFLRNVVSTVNVKNTAYKFGNPIHFQNLLSPAARDAIHESDAVIDFYFNHPNVPMFVAKKLIQRFTGSNPSPRYIKRVSDAFRTGSFTTRNVKFGDDTYGNLEATLAAVILEREARSVILDADPVAGSMREPALKIISFLRAMEFVKREQSPQLRIRWEGIGNLPYNADSVFGFFEDAYAGSNNLALAKLVSPEKSAIDSVSTISFLNAMSSLIENGITSCYGGLGDETTRECWRFNQGSDNSFDKDRQSRGKLTFLPRKPENGAIVVREMTLLLTGGRMNASSRNLLESAYNEEFIEKGSDAAIRLLQRLFLYTPEYHSTGVFRPNGFERELDEPSTSLPEEDYKAVVYFFLNGGIDGYNVLIPHSDCGSKDMFEQYQTVRGNNALSKTSLSNTLINAAASSQVCDTFGVHSSIPILKQLYDDGDLSFVANTGLLNEYVTTRDFNVKTKIKIGAHNIQRDEMMKQDVADIHPGKGVGGRMLDVLKKLNHLVSGTSVSRGGKVLESSSVPAINVNANGVERFSPMEFADKRLADLALLNNVASLGSNFMADIWARSLQFDIEENERIADAVQQANVQTSFPSTNFGIQFETIATMIDTKDIRKVNREVFFGEVIGFDHHFSIAGAMEQILTDLNMAFEKFVSELKLQGRWNDVTVVFLSDFGRTLHPNGSGGTDHGWGNNLWVAGGDLEGGKILGQYPDDLTNANQYIYSGITIPTTPLDSVWNSIAEWMGVTSEDDLNMVVPNRNSFSDLWDINVLYGDGS